jgi:hypothetical protein
MRPQYSTKMPLAVAGVLVIVLIGVHFGGLVFPWSDAEGNPSHPLLATAQSVLVTFLRALVAVLVAMTIYARLSKWKHRLLVIVGFLLLGLAFHLAAMGMRTDLSPWRRWPPWSPPLVDSLGLLCDLIWPALIGLTLIPLLGRKRI